MGRSIVAVIVSYIIMFVLNLIGFVTLYAVVGEAQAFRPRMYLASNRWIAISFAFIFVSAIIAGLICAVIAKGGKANLALAVVIIVLGFLLAIPAVMKANANASLVRTGPTPQMEAAKKAYWPIWTPFTFPIISALGVLIGGRLKKRS
jgi:hypothetical protein